MNKPSVIALTGRAGCGKTTVAKHLVIEHGYVRVRFAGVLKDMLRVLGLTEDEIEGGLKEAPCSALLGITPRHAMQTLGTEWGRDMIHPDLWAHIWKLRVAAQLTLGHKVVCDDCRFANETKFISTFQGAEIWSVRREAQNKTGSDEHISETEIASLHYDRTLYNYTTIEDLHKSIDSILISE